MRLPGLPPKASFSVVRDATTAEPEYDTTGDGYTKLCEDLQELVGCDCWAVAVRFGDEAVEPVFSTYWEESLTLRDIIMNDLVRHEIIKSIHRSILVQFNRREQAGSIYIYLMSGNNLTVVDAQYDPLDKRCKVVTHAFSDEQTA